MPTQIPRRNIQYGFPNPLKSLQQEPIIQNRAPTVADQAELGALWVFPSQQDAWILVQQGTNIAGNVWTNIAPGGGGAGVFTSLTVNPGPTSLTGRFTVIAGTQPISIGADSANHSITIGNETGLSTLDLLAGTGGASIEVASTGPIDIGGLNLPGIISIGSTGMTANIQIGNSTAGQAISIGGATVTGTQSINIGNAASGSGKDFIAIGNLNGASSLSLEAGTIGISVETADTGPITVGSSSMTANIQIGNALVGQAISIGGAANTGAQTINIGENASGAGTNVIVMGSLANASHTTLQAGTAGITLTAPFVALPGPVYIYTGAGAPSAGLALHVGDLYVNTTAASATTRMYIATAASTWTNVTCAA